MKLKDEQAIQRLCELFCVRKDFCDAANCPKRSPQLELTILMRDFVTEMQNMPVYPKNKSFSSSEMKLFLIEVIERLIEHAARNVR